MENNTSFVKQELAHIAHIKQVRKLKDKLTDIKTAMLTSLTAEVLPHSRPMYTHELQDDGILWFFTYKDSAKAKEITANPDIVLTYNHPVKNLFVSVTARAAIVHDFNKNDELWQPFFTSWFPEGKDDPGLALIKAEPVKAEYWDVPTGIGEFISFIKSGITGTPDHGYNEVINL